MSGQSLDVKNTTTLPGARGAITDLGAAQDGARTFTNGGLPGDQVQIVISADGTFNDATVLGYVSGGDPPWTPVTNQGKTPAFRYVRTIRTGIADSGAPTFYVEVSSPELSTGGSGGTGVVNGGQPGPVTVGTTDNTTTTIEANSVAGYVQQGSGALTLGTLVGATSTKIQSGTGGIGIGTLPPGTSGVAIDASAAGPVDLGNTNATTVQIGGANLTGTSYWQIGAAGVLELGTNATDHTTAMGSISGVSPTLVQAGSSGFSLDSRGPTSIVSGATTDLSVISGTTGQAILDSGSTGNVKVGTGASAKAVTIGNTTGATSVRVNAGSGGIGIGTAAPGSSGVSIDCPNAGGTMLLGAANTSTVAIGSGVSTLATVAIRLGVAGTIGIGDSAIVTALTLGSTTTTSTTTINAGSGGLQVLTDAVAHTINIGTGNAIQTISIGNHATPVNVIKIGGAASTIGFFGATPVVQGAASANAAISAAGSTAANTETTYTGGTGTAAYSVGGLVLRLKQLGLIVT